MNTSRMTKAMAVLAVVALSTTSAFAAIDAKAVRLDFDARTALDKTFTDYRVLDVNLAQVQDSMKAGRLELNLEDRQFVMDMELVNILTDDFVWVRETADGRVVEQPGVSSNYNGVLHGNSNASVRLSSRDDHFGGYIRTEDEWLFIDPLAEFIAGAPSNLIVVYRDGDVRPDPSRTCGTERLSDIAHEILGQLPANGGGQAPEGGFPIAEFSIEVDGNYEDEHGNQGTKDRIKDVMFEVIDIYEAQVQVTLKFGYGHIWTSAGSDPYTSNDAETTLDQFVDYWLANEPLFDVMHMFSGKNFNFGIAGIAYLDAVCCSGFLCPPGAFGISQDLNSQSDRVTVTAHEIGHNFSAGHSDGCSGVNCNGFGPIMCSFIQSNGSQTFAQCSEDSIESWVANNGSCLD